MTNLNQAVLTVKAKGIANSQQEFTDIFFALHERTEQAVAQFLNSKFPNVPLDKESVLSYCLYDHLTRILDSFDPSKGQFEPFFFSTLHRGILNGLQNQLTKKNQPNLQVVSTDTELDDTGLTLLDTLANPEEVEEFSDKMLEAIERFAKKQGEQARQVLMVLSQLDGQQRTEALCQVFGVDSYNTNVRKKVERIKSQFAKVLKGVK